MSLKNEYQNLLKDTLIYLENIDKLVESNSDFFIEDIKSLKKSKSQNTSFQKKKYNVNLQNFDKATRENPDKNILQNEKENIKKEFNDKKSTDTKNILDNEKEKPFENTTNSKLSKNKESQNLEKPLLKDPIKKIDNNKKIQRDQKPKIIEDSFIDIKKTIEKTFSNITYLKEPIDDRKAKLKSQKYKLKNIASTITILAYKENEKHYRFLEKLTIALDIYFYPTKIISAYLIEKENTLEELLKSDISLIIASDYTIFELASLRKHYRENPTKSEKYLKDTPLFLLPDISLYLKEPSLKASLFKALKQKIETLKNVK